MFIITYLLDKIGLKGILLTTGALAALLVSFLAFQHYNDLLSERNMLSNKAVRLQSSINTQSQVIDMQAGAIDEWRAKEAEWTQLIEDSFKKTREAEDALRRMYALFKKHDLSFLASKKPGLIQSRINAGTANALRVLECASGATNKKCPARSTKTEKPAEATTARAPKAKTN